MKNVWIRLLVFGLLLTLGASSASAFVLLSPKRTWASTPTYIVDNRGLTGVNDGDGGASRTRSAIVSTAAWNGAGCGTVINAVVGSVSGFQLGDGVPMLNFRDPINACTGNCLAATFTGFFSGSTITDADIVTNASGHSWTSQGEDPNGAGCSNEIYIEGVMVHEIGHGLGLAHTNVSGATMFPSVSSCNNGPATTEADDEAGLRDLYCPGGGGGGDSCAGFCGGQAPAGCWCDTACINFGDCCPDKRVQCGGSGAAGTCVGSCGLQSAPGSCWCDSLCSQFGDCCPNKVSICG